MKKDLKQIKSHQRLMNPQTLEQLIANGANPNMVHTIINVFHVFSEDDIERLIKKIEMKSFSIHDKPELMHDEEETDDLEYIDYWLVEAEKKTVLSLDLLNDMTDDCVAAITDINALYDGWYTEVVPTVH